MKRPSTPLLFLVMSFSHVLLILAPFRQTYGENDNLGILYDIQGGHTVSFMSVLLGKVLSFFYLHISGAVPWYGLLLYAVSGLALFLAMLSLNALCRHRWLKYGAMALLMAFFSRFIATVDYNAASITIGFSSLLAVMVYLRSTTRPRIWVILGLGFLFSFSYLIRTMGLKAVLVFAAITLGFEAITRFRTSVIPAALFLLPLAMLYGVDTGIRTYGVSEEYRHFKEWNAARGKFHDFPVSRLNAKNVEIQKANNWTPADYRMLENWAFFNEDKFNIRTINNIYRLSVPLPGSDGILYGEIATNFLVILRDYWRFWIPLMALAGFSFFRNRRGLVLLQISQNLFLLTGAALMATYFRFPERVAYPLFFGILLLSFFFTFRDDMVPNGDPARARKSRDDRYLWVLALILLFSAMVEIPVTAARIKKRSADQVHFYKSVAFLEDLEPEFLLLQAGSVLGAQCQDPLVANQNRLPSVPGGWTIFSPRFYEFLRDHGLESGREVVPHLVDGERTYVVCTKRFIRLLERYLQISLGTPTRFMEIRRLDDNTSIYKVTSARRPFIEPTPLRPSSGRGRK